MTEEEAIHTRLDYIEKIFNEKMGQMADSISQLAQSTNNLNDKLSDVSLLMERSNQQSIQIKNNDSRLDKVEQRVPIYNLSVKIGAIFGTVFIVGTATAIFKLV